MKCHTCVAIVAVATALVGHAEPTEPMAGTAVVRTVDFRGKPPFERRLVRLPATEAARLEAELRTIAPAAELVPVRTIDFRGKPPYRRRVEYVPVVDTARLEPVAEELEGERDRTDFRGRPPFRRAPR